MQAQQSMNNAEKQGEKWAAKAHNALDRGVAELKNIGETDIKAFASDVSGRVRDLSGDAYQGTLDLVRKYPVTAALSLAAVGFFAGMMSARSRES